LGRPLVRTDTMVGKRKRYSAEVKAEVALEAPGCELTTAHWFDLTAARQELGYKPSVSTEEGLRRLQHALQTGQSPC